MAMKQFITLAGSRLFVLERGQTDATERHTHAGGYTAGLGNNRFV